MLRDDPDNPIRRPGARNRAALESGAKRPCSAAEQKRVQARLVNRDKVNESGKNKKRKIHISPTLKRYDGRAVRGRAREDPGLRAFWDNLDLPQFKEALSFAEDPRHKMLMLAMTSPKMRKMSFPELCRRCQLTLRDISSFWRSHQIQKGMIRMMNEMPEVMQDVAIDSKSREVPCHSCDGTGKTTRETFNRQVGSICPECHGDGKIRVIGDKDARNLVFEAAGLKKSGIAMQQNVNINAPSSVEDTIKELEGAIDIQPEPEEASETEEITDA